MAEVGPEIACGGEDGKGRDEGGGRGGGGWTLVVEMVEEEWRDGGRERGGSGRQMWRGRPKWCCRK